MPCERVDCERIRVDPRSEDLEKSGLWCEMHLHGDAVPRERVDCGNELAVRGTVLRAGQVVDGVKDDVEHGRQLADNDDGVLGMLERRAEMRRVNDARKKVGRRCKECCRMNVEEDSVRRDKDEILRSGTCEATGVKPGRHSDVCRLSFSYSRCAHHP